ncbi:MAG: hypothetical protein IJ333_01975 [Clostridia bacterium]|nr:hypothetical protein [Clostridia bacterium]
MFNDLSMCSCILMLIWGFTVLTGAIKRIRVTLFVTAHLFLYGPLLKDLDFAADTDPFAFTLVNILIPILLAIYKLLLDRPPIRKWFTPMNGVYIILTVILIVMAMVVFK